MTRVRKGKIERRGKIYIVLIIFPLVEHFWHIDRMRRHPAKQVKALDFGMVRAIVYA